MAGFNAYVGRNFDRKGNKGWIKSVHPEYIMRKEKGTIGRVRKYRKKK